MSLTDEDKQWINAQLDTKLERLETTLLTEFHKWANPNEARMRTHTAALRAIDLEMEAALNRAIKLDGPHQKN
jgi:hypothetical protein